MVVLNVYQKMIVKTVTKLVFWFVLFFTGIYISVHLTEIQSITLEKYN